MEVVGVTGGLGANAREGGDSLAVLEWAEEERGGRDGSFAGHPLRRVRAFRLASTEASLECTATEPDDLHLLREIRAGVLGRLCS